MDRILSAFNRPKPSPWRTPVSGSSRPDEDRRAAVPPCPVSGTWVEEEQRSRAVRRCDPKVLFRVFADRSPEILGYITKKVALASLGCRILSNCNDRPKTPTCPEDTCNSNALAGLAFSPIVSIEKPRNGSASVPELEIPDVATEPQQDRQTDTKVRGEKGGHGSDEQPRPWHLAHVFQSHGEKM
jgi:hypothetical protein